MRREPPAIAAAERPSAAAVRRGGGPPACGGSAAARSVATRQRSQLRLDAFSSRRAAGKRESGAPRAFQRKLSGKRASARRELRRRARVRRRAGCGCRLNRQLIDEPALRGRQGQNSAAAGFSARFRRPGESRGARACSKSLPACLFVPPRLRKPSGAEPVRLGAAAWPLPHTIRAASRLICRAAVHAPRQWRPSRYCWWTWMTRCTA